MITLFAMLILLFVGIALIIAGAFLFAWIIFVIGFILAIIRFFKARKLFPTDKVCPYCDHTDLSFTHNTSKKGAPTIAVCQNCGQKFDFWTEEEIKKVQKKQLIRMIVFGILTLLTSVMMFAGGGTESDAVEQSAVSEQVPAENNQVADKEEKKASYDITNHYFVSYTNALGEPAYDAIIEITNTGSTNLYLHANSFDIEDANNKLITTESLINTCPDLISPGEKGYLYLGLGGRYPSGTDVNQELTLKPNMDIRVGTADPVDYEVSDTSINAGNFGYPQVIGRVTNQTSNDDALVYVQAVFFDNDGNPIAISGTNLTDLKAGSTQSFEINLMQSNKIELSQIATYQVIARKSHMQFN